MTERYTKLRSLAESLIENHSGEMEYTLANDANTHPNILASIYNNTSDTYLIRRLARNPNLPPELFKDIAQKHFDAIPELLQNEVWTLLSLENPRFIESFLKSLTAQARENLLRDAEDTLFMNVIGDVDNERMVKRHYTYHDRHRELADRVQSDPDDFDAEELLNQTPVDVYEMISGWYGVRWDDGRFTWFHSFQELRKHVTVFYYPDDILKLSD